MTLFETLVALVILGLAAVGFLGAFQATARATHDAAEWVQAVGYADAAMEQSRLGSGAAALPFADSLASGFGRSIQVQPWPGRAGIEQVSVTIALPDGGNFVLHRLVQSQ